MNQEEEKRYKCDTCNYATNKRSRLIRHERIHTGEKPFKCNQCNYVAAQHSALKSHELKHKGEKPNKCDQCDYASIYPSDLTKHKRTHTGEKPYKCHQCNYASAYSSHLRDHKRKHTGEKPFKCDQCDYASTQSSHLTSHKRTHTGEKPFKCDRCDYASAQSSNLTAHKRTHTGDKPYKCATRDFSSKYRAPLDSHKRSAHMTEKNEQCPRCEAIFPSKRALTSHLRSCDTEPNATVTHVCEPSTLLSSDTADRVDIPKALLKKVKPCSVQIRRLSEERINSLFQTPLPSNNGVMDIKREPCPDTNGTDHPPNINEGTLLERPCFKINPPSIKEEPSDFVDEVPISSNVTRDYVECRDADRSKIKIEH